MRRCVKQAVVPVANDVNIDRATLDGLQCCFCYEIFADSHEVLFADIMQNSFKV